MLCYECAKQDEEVAAVAICPICGAGLCMHHVHQAAEFSVGGTHIGCMHDTWKPSVAREALIAEKMASR